MKYSEGYVVDKNEMAAGVKRIVSDLLAGRLEVEGKNVEIPGDTDLDVKSKYAVDEAGGAFTLKISWQAEEAEAAAEEETF